MSRIFKISVVFFVLAVYLYFYKSGIEDNAVEEISNSDSIAVVTGAFTEPNEEIIDKAVKKSLQGIIDGKTVDQSISKEEMNVLAEMVKKTDHQYQEHLILSENPELKEFRSLFYKVLKDEGSRKAYSDILGDMALADKVVLSLNNVGPDFEFKDQVKRIIYVDLLNEMISNSQKSGEGYIHRVVSEIITSSIVFDKSLPEELRRSLYSDRIEVFKRYAGVYYEDAKVAMNQVPNSKYRDYLEDILKQLEEQG